MLLLDDARVIHETTPIQPDGEPGVRDTLVIVLIGAAAFRIRVVRFAWRQSRASKPQQRRIRNPSPTIQRSRNKPSRMKPELSPGWAERRCADQYPLPPVQNQFAKSKANQRADCQTCSPLRQCGRAMP